MDRKTERGNEERENQRKSWGGEQISKEKESSGFGGVF